MSFSPEKNIFHAGFMDTPEATEYIRTHGTFPPFISEGETPEATRDFLENQINDMRLVAEGSIDREISERLVHEIGYLTEILMRFNQ